MSYAFEFQTVFLLVFLTFVPVWVFSIGENAHAYVSVCASDAHDRVDAHACASSMTLQRLEITFIKVLEGVRV